MLSVDPLGAVGDGQAEAFGAEMLARVPENLRERARTLDEKDTAGEATPEETQEAFSLFWGSYFADPAAAPPMPHIEFSKPASQGLWADLMARLPELESLATGDQDPGRRARRRTEPDATSALASTPPSGSRRLVPHRARSRALPVARVAWLPARCHGSAGHRQRNDLVVQLGAALKRVDGRGGGYDFARIVQRMKASH